MIWDNCFSNHTHKRPAQWSLVLQQLLSHILCNVKVYDSIHNSLPLIPILGRTKPVHALPTNFFKIHVNIILQSIPRSYAGIESRKKQAMIPPPTFLSQYSRINLSLCALEGIWGREAMAPTIFNFWTTCRRTVSFTLQLGHTP